MSLNYAYVLVKSNITATVAPTTQLSFKNCAPFTKCITKINGTATVDQEEINLVMLLHNLIEYSSNYPEITRGLCCFSKHE